MLKRAFVTEGTVTFVTFFNSCLNSLLCHQTIKIKECFSSQDQSSDNARDGDLQPLGATGLTEAAVLWLAPRHTSPVRQQVYRKRYPSVQLTRFFVPAIRSLSCHLTR